MWWHDKHVGLSLLSLRGQVWERAVARLPSPTLLGRRRVLRAAAALGIAALAGGCFQPLYGEQSPMGGPVLRDQLSAVDIVQIEAPKGSDEARLAVEMSGANRMRPHDSSAARVRARKRRCSSGSLV